MARLKRRRDGAYYIVGRLPEGGICTWQVTPAGALYLEGSGHSQGSQLEPDVMDQLRRNALIYTGGAGPGSVDPFATPGEAAHHTRTTRKSGCLGCGCLGGSLLGAILALGIVLLRPRSGQGER